MDSAMRYFLMQCNLLPILMADSRQKAKAYKCIALVIKRGIQVQVIELVIQMNFHFPVNSLSFRAKKSCEKKKV